MGLSRIQLAMIQKPIPWASFHSIRGTMQAVKGGKKTINTYLDVMPTTIIMTIMVRYP